MIALTSPAPPEPALLAAPPSAPTDEATTTTHPADPIQDADDAAASSATLKLRACAHVFHAECLVSWFVLRKTTCPICRAAYISKQDMQAYEDEEAAETGFVHVQPLTVQEQSPPPPDRHAGRWTYFWAAHSVGVRQGGAADDDVEGRRGQRHAWWRGRHS
ncbi:hypothetical protein ACEQ8H_006839 [Pleosporales sp. CAS-2024a]